MAAASYSCKDLLERISPASPQDRMLRTCTGSCKDLFERKLAGSPQEPVDASIYNENAACPELENPAASLHSRNALGQEFAGNMLGPKMGTHALCELAQSTCTWTSYKSNSMQDFTGTCQGPRWGRTLCPSLRSRNEDGHPKRADSCENLPGGGAQDLETH